MNIRAKQSLRGFIDHKASLNGQIYSKNRIVGIVQTGSVMVKEYPTYDGPHVVTPAIKEQTLDTAQKLVTDNIQILSIPYVEVTNTSGGMTVTIGSEE